MNTLSTRFLLPLLGAGLLLGGCAATGGAAGDDSASQQQGQQSEEQQGAAGSAGGAPQGAESSPAGTQENGPGGSAVPQNGRTASPAADGRAGGSAQPAGPAQTPEERRAAIDRRLNDSIGTLDAEIRREQERTARERDERTPAGGGTVETERDGDPREARDGEARDGDELPGSADSELPPPGASEGRGERSSRPGDLRSDRAEDRGAAEGAGAGARNIPDGSDDDAVARRLRRAAEQETDPELKDKLWKEYIDYKNNAQRR
jgi:hypothetical protein